MGPDMSQLGALAPQDALVLMALFNATGPASPWVEKKAFRHDQLAHRQAIDRLKQEGCIREERQGDTECYGLSLTALSQLREQPAIAEVLDTAERMWGEFQRHFEKSMDAPIALLEIARSIGKPIDHVTLVHTYMREWWHTPNVITAADVSVKLIIVREDVFDHNSFGDCIRALGHSQAERAQAAPHAFRSLAMLGEAPAQQVDSTRPVFQEPSWFTRLPPHAQAMMREVHVAQHEGLLALTAMGVRAVIDVVADDLLRSAGWTFGKKLSELRNAEHLTQAQFEAIRAVVEVGHAAAHRAHVPSERDVQLMLEALNNVLCSAYGLQGTPHELNSRTPPNPNAAKGSKGP